MGLEVDDLPEAAEGGEVPPPPRSSTPHPVWPRGSGPESSRWMDLQTERTGTSMAPGSWAWSPVSGRVVTGFGHQFKVFVSVLGGVCGCPFVK